VGEPTAAEGFAIRPAREADAAALAPLSTELGYPATDAELRERLRACLASDRDRVLVALDPDGVPIGWLHAARARRLTTAPFLEIEGLVVAGPARGRGIGRALVAEAVRLAREEGLPTVRVRSRTERERAHAFYEDFGFRRKKTQLVFELHRSGSS